MGRELPVVKRTPVLAGERHRSVLRFRRVPGRSQAPGFAGRAEPTVGLIDGTFRANLEETGMGYGLEVDMIRLGTRRAC